MSTIHCLKSAREEKEKRKEDFRPRVCLVSQSSNLSFFNAHRKGCLEDTNGAFNERGKHDSNRASSMTQMAASHSETSSCSYGHMDKDPGSFLPSFRDYQQHFTASLYQFKLHPKTSPRSASPHQPPPGLSMRIPSLSKQCKQVRKWSAQGLQSKVN